MGLHKYTRKKEFIYSKNIIIIMIKPLTYQIPYKQKTNQRFKLCFLQSQFEIIKDLKIRQNKTVMVFFG